MYNACAVIMKSYVGVAMKARLEAESDFESTIKDNCIELLKRIRELTQKTSENHRMKEQFGAHLLDSFVEWTQEFRAITSNATDKRNKASVEKTQQENLKKPAMEIAVF